MLDTLSAADFKDYLNQKFQVILQDLSIEMNLHTIKENPKSLPPQSNSQRRIPFSIIFTCDSDQAIDTGICTIKHPTLGDIEQVSINRIAPLNIDEPLAWYQVVFN